MTERFQSRTLFRLTVISAFLVTLIVLVTVVPVTAQVDVSDKSNEQQPEGTLAKYLSFYGTGRADWAVLTIGATGTPITWKIRKNQAGPEVSSTFNFGVVGDVISPGSYTGDVTFDPAIWRSVAGANAQTWIDPFDNGAGTPYTVIPFGTAGDNAARNGDYDGDGIEDVAIIRIVGGVLQWWIRPSSNPTAARVVNFGTTLANNSLFAFEGADFTGDGRDELVLARVLNLTGATTWYVGDAVTGAQINQVQWGNFNTDFLINPADYSGDGRADYAVWRAGGTGPDARVWYIINGATGQQLPPVWFGIGDPNFTDNDLPIRGDYDGDGIHDIAVFRPTTNTFWVLASSNSNLIVQQWGATDDVPLGNFFTF